MKKITLNLYVPLIMESVKQETLIKGRIDKATDAKATELAFNEEAGDEDFHERKLYRTLHSSLSRLMSKLGDYVDPKIDLVGDNGYSVTTEQIVITLNVSNRFNDSLTDPLARLCSKYIEDHMLYLWWGTFNVKQAEFYKSLVEFDWLDIEACFKKTAPEVPTVKYPDSINVDEYIRTQLGNVIKANVGEAFSVTYQVSDGCIDDVQASSDSSAVSVTGKSGRTFYLQGNRVGVSTITLYSKHTNASHQIQVVVR